MHAPSFRLQLFRLCNNRCSLGPCGWTEILFWISFLLSKEVKKVIYIKLHWCNWYDIFYQFESSNSILMNFALNIPSYTAALPSISPHAPQLCTQYPLIPRALLSISPHALQLTLNIPSCITTNPSISIPTLKKLP